MELLTTLFRQILRLRQISMLVLVLLVAVAAFTSFTSGRSTVGDPKKAVASAENKLVGTWKQVKAKFGGKEHKIPEGTTQFKHITPTHFMFVDIDKDGNVFDSLGGPYTLKGAKYEETPEYGGGTIAEVFKVLKGKPQSFECKVEGARWYHNGTLSNGLTIEEVWERVEKK